MSELLYYWLYFPTIIQKIESLWHKIRSYPLYYWLLIALLVTQGARAIEDPDLGWHLRAGKYFIENGIPITDPFSHTMPDWEWVDHEWLSDIFLAFIHSSLPSGWDLLVLHIIYALILAGGFYLAASAIPKVKPQYKVLAALIGLLAALPIVGVRQQIFTLVGLAGILWFYYRYLTGILENKHLWLLPVWLALWANVHGGFLAGVGLLGLIALGELSKILITRYYSKTKKYIDEKIFTAKQWWNWVGISAVSGLATLMNPYGWRLHYDLYLTLTDNYALQHISEWKPVSIDNFISHSYIAYLVLFGFVLLLTYRKIEPTRWIFAGFFLGFSLMSWRNMPLFVIISVGFLATIFQEQIGKVIDDILRSRFGTLLVVIGAAALLSFRLTELIPKSFNSYALAGDRLPAKAVEWIKENPDQVGDKMFNEYAWGGYLNWKLPEYKVFIDGRMPFWRLPGRHIFKDQQQALYGSPKAFDILEKYEVDWVLIHKRRPLDLMLRSRLDEWQMVYTDAKSVIFTKKSVLGSPENETDD